MTTPPLSRPIRASTVRGVESHRITAGPEERAGLAASLGIESVDRLEAVFEVRPWRKRGLRVDGQLAASVTQACAVTFAPVISEIEERVAERLMPTEAVTPIRENVIDVEATDDFEVFGNDEVDLGALAYEYLVMGLDPYPRAPGVEFESTNEAEGAEIGRESPFAVLKGLAGAGVRPAGKPADTDGRRGSDGPDRAGSGAGDRGGAGASRRR